MKVVLLLITFVYFPLYYIDMILLESKTFSFILLVLFKKNFTS
jgi:hypothetical protein